MKRQHIAFLWGHGPVHLPRLASMALVLAFTGIFACTATPALADNVFDKELNPSPFNVDGSTLSGNITVTNDAKVVVTTGIIPTLSSLTIGSNTYKSSSLDLQVDVTINGPITIRGDSSLSLRNATVAGAISLSTNNNTPKLFLSAGTLTSPQGITLVSSKLYMDDYDVHANVTITNSNIYVNSSTKNHISTITGKLKLENSVLSLIGPAAQLTTGIVTLTRNNIFNGQNNVGSCFTVDGFDGTGTLTIEEGGAIKFSANGSFSVNQPGLRLHNGGSIYAVQALEIKESTLLSHRTDTNLALGAGTFVLAGDTTFGSSTSAGSTTVSLTGAGKLSNRNFTVLGNNTGVGTLNLGSVDNVSSLNSVVLIGSGNSTATALNIFAQKFTSPLLKLTNTTTTIGNGNVASEAVFNSVTLVGSNVFTVAQNSKLEFLGLLNASGDTNLNIGAGGTLTLKTDTVINADKLLVAATGTIIASGKINLRGNTDKIGMLGTLTASTLNLEQNAANFTGGTWNLGDLNATALNLKGSAVVNLGKVGVVSTNNRTFANAVTLAGTSQLNIVDGTWTIGDAAHTITLEPDAALKVAAGAILTINNNFSVTNNKLAVGATGALTVADTLTLTDASTDGISGTINVSNLAFTTGGIPGAAPVAANINAGTWNITNKAKDVPSAISAASLRLTNAVQLNLNDLGSTNAVLSLEGTAQLNLKSTSGGTPATVIKSSNWTIGGLIIGTNAQANIEAESTLQINNSFTLAGNKLSTTASSGALSMTSTSKLIVRDTLTLTGTAAATTIVGNISARDLAFTTDDAAKTPVAAQLASGEWTITGNTNPSMAFLTASSLKMSAGNVLNLGPTAQKGHGGTFAQEVTVGGNSTLNVHQGTWTLGDTTVTDANSKLNVNNGGLLTVAKLTVGNTAAAVTVEGGGKMVFGTVATTTRNINIGSIVVNIGGVVQTKFDSVATITTGSNATWLKSDPAFQGIFYIHDGGTLVLTGKEYNTAPSLSTMYNLKDVQKLRTELFKPDVGNTIHGLLEIRDAKYSNANGDYTVAEIDGVKSNDAQLKDTEANISSSPGLSSGVDNIVIIDTPGTPPTGPIVIIAEDLRVQGFDESTHQPNNQLVTGNDGTTIITNVTVKDDGSFTLGDADGDKEHPTHGTWDGDITIGDAGTTHPVNPEGSGKVIISDIDLIINGDIISNGGTATDKSHVVIKESDVTFGPDNRTIPPGPGGIDLSNGETDLTIIDSKVKADHILVGGDTTINNSTVTVDEKLAMNGETNSITNGSNVTAKDIFTGDGTTTPLKTHTLVVENSTLTATNDVNIGKNNDWYVTDSIVKVGNNVTLAEGAKAIISTTADSKIRSDVTVDGTLKSSKTSEVLVTDSTLNIGTLELYGTTEIHGSKITGNKLVADFVEPDEGNSEFTLSGSELKMNDVQIGANSIWIENSMVEANTFSNVGKANNVGTIISTSDITHSTITATQTMDLGETNFINSHMVAPTMSLVGGKYILLDMGSTLTASGTLTLKAGAEMEILNGSSVTVASLHMVAGTAKPTRINLGSWGTYKDVLDDPSILTEPFSGSSLSAGNASFNGGIMYIRAGGFLDDPEKSGSTVAIGAGSDKSTEHFSLDGRIITSRGAKLTLGSSSPAMLTSVLMETAALQNTWGVKDTTGKEVHEAVYLAKPLQFTADANSAYLRMGSKFADTGDYDGKTLSRAVGRAVNTPTTNQLYLAKDSLLILDVSILRETKGAAITAFPNQVAIIEAGAQINMDNARDGDQVSILTGFTSVNDEKGQQATILGKQISFKNILLKAGDVVITSSGVNMNVVADKAIEVLPDISEGGASIIDKYMSQPLKNAFMDQVLSGAGKNTNSISNALEAGLDLARAANVTGTGLDTVNTNMRVVLNRSSSNLNPEAANPQGTRVKASVWGMPLFSSTSSTHSLTGTSFKVKNDLNLYGGILGADLNFSQARLGISVNVGQGKNKGHSAGINTDNNFDYAGAALYAQYTFGKFNLGATVGFTSMNSEITQKQTDLVLSAKPDTNLFSAGLEGTYTFELQNGINIIPSLGVEWVHNNQDSYDTSMRNAGNVIHAASASNSQMQVPVGVKVQKNFTLSNGIVLMPEMRAKVITTFGNTMDSKVNLTGIESANAKLKGVASDKLMGEIGASLPIGINDSLSLSADYDLGLSKNVVKHNVRAMLKYSF